MKTNLAVFSGVEFKPSLTRRILTLLIAFELIFSFSSLGFFQTDATLPISVTFINIIIILAAMVFGPLTGATAGLVYGLCRMWRIDTAPISELGRLFSSRYSGDLAGSIILSTVPHILAGLIIGLLFRLAFRHLPKSTHLVMVAVFSCLGLYIHRFLTYFTLWWEFPKAGLTVSRAVFPGFSPPILINWALCSIVAVWVYSLFTDPKIISLLKEHEALSSESDTRIRRTILYSAIAFLVLVSSIFFYLSDRREIIFQMAGIVPTPEMLRGLTSLSLQAMVVLGAALVIIDLAMLWQRETFLIAKKTHELEVRNIDEKHQQDQLKLVSTMSSIYCETYYVNIPASKNEPFTFLTLKQDQSLRDTIPATGDCNMFIQDDIINQVIEPDSQTEMIAFLDTKTMTERLTKGGGSILAEFLHKLHGWCRASLIVAEKDEENRPRRVLLTIQVIDEQKRQQMEMHEALTAALDNATSANAAKSNFLVRMSHDLRTPMNDILGITTIAGTHLDDMDRVKDCLNRINLSSKQLLLLINEILDMSQIESGNLELFSEDFSLPELLDNLSSLITPMTEKKNQTLEFQVSNFFHELFVGDSRRIQQIFMSLVDNAIRFTPEGGTIRITAEEKTSNRLDIANFEFTVEDTGYGIKPDELSYIFEPFYLSKDPQVSRFQGSGLGLPIAKNLARMMLGDIRAESTYGKGSRFTVTFSLPIHKGTSISGRQDFLGLRVLAISDQPLSADSVCETMNQMGLKAEWIISDTAAISRAVEAHEAGKDLDAILFDWDSSSINNMEIISSLRRRLVNDTPVLIAASSNTALVEREAKEAGVSFLISKPLFKSRLRQLFNEVSDKGETAARLLGVEEATTADFTGTRGLLVEDNELNAEIAAEILGMTGMTVDFARDGKEAVDKIASSEDGFYDVVFMDIQMPLMNGYEATRAIRAIGREYTERIPIFAMSANALAEDIVASKESGMNEHISKPVDYDQLTQLLKRWLRK